MLPDLQFLHRLADAADAVTLPLFRSKLAVEGKVSPQKPFFDPVTEADRGAERAMRALLAEVWPDHGVLGEEYPPTNAGARALWHLDPVDGTRQFVTGVPLWGTLAGLAVDGAPTFGLLSQPFTRERFLAGPGFAIYRGPDGVETEMHTSACASLGDASLFTTSPELMKDEAGARFKALSQQVRITRYGIDCYAFGLVALGAIDIAIEAGVQSYDVMALEPLVREAGGAMVHWDGAPLRGGGNVVAVGDRSLLPQVLSLLS